MLLDCSHPYRKGEDVAINMERLQALADTVTREKDKQGDERGRLDLTIFLHDDGSLRIYTSMVGSSGKAVRAVVPAVHCSNRLEAGGAIAEILRLSQSS
jgi:hypothetical protein